MVKQMLRRFAFASIVLSVLGIALSPAINAQTTESYSNFVSRAPAAGPVTATDIIPDTRSGPLTYQTTPAALATYVAGTLNLSGIAGQVSLLQLPSIPTNTVIGNLSGVTAAPSALSSAQLTSMINAATSSTLGAVRPDNSTITVNGSGVLTVIGGGGGGISGPGSSISGYVPQWNGTGGNALSGGLPVGITGATTILESTSAGYLAAGAMGALTGDITSPGGSYATTLATVNSNVGTFQGLTINAKGQVTGAVNENYAPLASPAFTGGVTIGSPTGGSPPSGSINVAGNVFVNDVALSNGNFTQGANITITGTWPNLTFAASGGSGSGCVPSGSLGDALVDSGSGSCQDRPYTLPGTITANELLYASGTGAIGQIATADNGVLVTDGSGVPSISTTLPSGLTIPSPTITTSFTATGLVTLADLASAAYGLTGNSVLVQTTSGGLLTASLLPAATTSTIGGMIVGTGLSVSSGTVTPSFGTAANQVAEGGIITAGGPTGSATVVPIIAYNAAGQLTTVSTATIAPNISNVAGLGTNVETALTTAVGSAGAFVVNGGALGTPSSGIATNVTGLPISTGVSGLGTGVATALGINIGTAGAPVVIGGALGTPSSGTATNLTGLPLTGLASQAANTVVVNATSGSASPTAESVSACSAASDALIWTMNIGFGCNTSITAATAPLSGITGFGANVETALATAVGSVGSLVINGGALGTPSSGTATNLTGLPISTGISGLGTGVAAAAADAVNASGGFLTVGGGVYLPLAGGTLTGKLVTAASASGGAGFNLPPGTAPSSPSNGDCWTTSNGLYCQINGSTVGPYGVTGSATSITVGTTTISFGTSGDIEYNNGGILGEKSVTGTGNVVLATSPTVASPTVTSSFTATGLVTLADLATQAANTVLVNATSGSASPTAESMTSCSTAGDALNWTTNTGFGCNTSITAAAAPLSGITGLGTGVATALTINIGSAGAPVLYNGAGGTPSGLTLTNASGLPLSGLVDTGNQSSLLGNPTGSAASYENITLAGGLCFVGTTLAPCQPFGTTVTSSRSIASTDMGLFVPVNGSSIALTIPSSGYGVTVFPYGEGACFPNYGSSPFTFTNTAGATIINQALTIYPGEMACLQADNASPPNLVETVSEAATINIARIPSIPISTGVSGLGTGVATALGNAVNATGGLTTYGTDLPLAGGTMTGELVTAASASGGAGFNLPQGTAPSSPANGDLWATSAGLYVRINGATVGPLNTGSGCTVSGSQYEILAVNSAGTGCASATTGSVNASGILDGVDASGSNASATSYVFRAPLSTGTATNPDLVFQTGVKTSSGSSAATATTALTLKGETQQAIFAGPIQAASVGTGTPATAACFDSSGNLIHNSANCLATLGVASGTSLALGGATIGTNALAVTGTSLLSGAVTVSGASFGMSGNQSVAAIGTAGVRYKNAAGTITDTGDSGTVAAGYAGVWGGNTYVASSATTFTNFYEHYYVAPIASTDVTFTHSYAIGGDSANFGTLAINGTATGALATVTPGTGVATAIGNAVNGTGGLTTYGTDLPLAGGTMTGTPSITPTTISATTCTGTYTLTPTGTTSVDYVLTCAASAAITIANPTTVQPGSSLNFRIAQPSTGTKATLSGVGSDYFFPGGTLPTLSAANSSVDIISCRVIASAEIDCAPAMLAMATP
jgi:hypothetical protein